MAGIRLFGLIAGKGGLHLLALGDVDHYLAGQPHLLQRHADLAAVGGVSRCRVRWSFSLYPAKAGYPVTRNVAALQRHPSSRRRRGPIRRVVADQAMLSRPFLNTNVRGYGSPPSRGRLRLLMARDRLWNAPRGADRLRPAPTREISLVQISLPRPPRRHHPQAIVRTRRNHPRLGPQKRFLFQSQADHARPRGRGIAGGIELRGTEGRQSGLYRRAGNGRGADRGFDRASFHG